MFYPFKRNFIFVPPVLNFPQQFQQPNYAKILNQAPTLQALKKVADNKIQATFKNLVKNQILELKLGQFTAKDLEQD